MTECTAIGKSQMTTQPEFFFLTPQLLAYETFFNTKKSKE